MSEPYLNLKGIRSLSDVGMQEQLRANLIAFFNWGLLNKGGFTSVTRTGSGNRHLLRPVTEDPKFSNGKVWEAFRGDWVWETGVEYATQPIGVSGVYVNNVFYPIGTTGANAFHINYPLGRVVFDNAIPTNSTVSVEYSFRYYNFTTSDVPWFREFLFNSYRLDSPHFNQQGSGAWANTVGATRVQMPAVVVEVSPRRTLVPLQLGGGHWVRQDVLFHIFAQEPWERDRLVDFITHQRDKTILSFNKNLMAANDAFPLDYRGSLRTNPKMYPDLVAPTSAGGFFWKKIFFREMIGQDTISAPPLYRAVVRGTFEMDFPEF